MASGNRPRLVLLGLIGGALLGFGLGCTFAAANDARVIERMRAQDPNAHVCGLSLFAVIAGGLVGAVPGGLLGAVAGAGCRWWWPAGDGPAGPAATG